METEFSSRRTVGCRELHPRRSHRPFIGLLLIQNKLWTADCINRTGGQANTVCQLCRAHNGSILHMLIQCEYSKRIWSCLAEWIRIDLQPPPLSTYHQFKMWWQSMVRAGTQSDLQHHEHAQKIIYTI
jgi:hypothetical protein